MARVKVRLADNIARVVFLEPDATRGATVGVNLFLNGRVATPAAFAQWLGTAAGGAVPGLQHSSLSGLQQGDDHPQYTMWQAAERITAQWAFDMPVRSNGGSESAPAFAFLNDTDTGVFSPSAGVIALSSNGDEHFRFGAAGELGIGGANFGTAQQALLSGGTGAAPVWTTLAPVALSNDYDDLDNKPPDVSGAEIVTVSDETSDLPNSRRLVAGTNVALDSTTPGQLVINVTGSGSGTVTSVDTGTGLTGGPITTTGTISLDSASIASLALADTAVQPGDLPDYSTVTMLTQSDETTTFPASRRIVAGTNITLNTTTPGQLIINAAGGGGGGLVDTVVAGAGIDVDNSDPINPIVSVDTTENFGWSGNHTFTAAGTGITAPVTIAHSQRPTLQWHTTGAGTNQKRWFAGAVDNSFYLYTRDDSNMGGAVWLRAGRSGVNVPVIEVTTSALGVGIAPTGPTGTTFHVGSTTSGATFHLSSATSGHDTLDGFVFQFWTDNNAYAWNYENGSVIFGTNAVERLRITPSGQLYGTALHNNPAGANGLNNFIASGTYTPAISFSGSAPEYVIAQWARVGNVVTVSGSFRANPGGASIFGRIPLPIPSTVGSGAFLWPLAGTLASSDTTYGFYAGITGGTSGDNNAVFYGTGNTNPGGGINFAFHFTYLVV